MIGHHQEVPLPLGPEAATGGHLFAAGEAVRLFGSESVSREARINRVARVQLRVAPENACREMLIAEGRVVAFGLHRSVDLNELFLDNRPMATRLQAQIVPIGNSQGIEIPCAVLEESGLERDVIIEVEEHRLVIHPASYPIGMESRINAEIDDLYTELRELTERSANEDGLGGEIEERTRRLRKLQAKAADAMEARFAASRYLSPGRAWRALEKARKILGDEDPTDDDETAES